MSQEILTRSFRGCADAVAHIEEVMALIPKVSRPSLSRALYEELLTYAGQLESYAREALDSIE